MPKSNAKAGLAVLLLFAAMSACTPTVKIEAPDKPIVINLNVKIEHEVRLHVERDVETLIKEKKELFE